MTIVTDFGTGQPAATPQAAEAGRSPDPVEALTSRGKVDEEYIGAYADNLANASGVDLTLEADASVRFKLLTYGSGPRMVNVSGANLISVATTNVILQDMQFLSAHANRTVVRVATAAHADTFIIRRNYIESNGSAGECVETTAANQSIEAHFNMIVTDQNVQMLMSRDGNATYNTILGIDGGAAPALGINAVGGKLIGNIVGNGVANEYNGGTGVGTEDNVGDLEVTPPSGNYYDITDEGFTLADLFPSTDGTDMSRDFADDAWTHFVVTTHGTTAASGTKDVLGNESDLLNMKCGCQQIDPATLIVATRRSSTGLHGWGMGLNFPFTSPN